MLHGSDIYWFLNSVKCQNFIPMQCRSSILIVFVDVPSLRNSKNLTPMQRGSAIPDIVIFVFLQILIPMQGRSEFSWCVRTLRTLNCGLNHYVYTTQIDFPKLSKKTPNTPNSLQTILFVVYFFYCWVFVGCFIAYPTGRKCTFTRILVYFFDF